MNKQKEISEGRHKDFQIKQARLSLDNDPNLMVDPKMALVDLLYDLALSNKAELLGKITLDAGFNDLKDEDYKDLRDLFMSDASAEETEAFYKEKNVKRK